MRKKLRLGGLAVVAVTALVTPLLAIDAAQAVIPKADLSITKLVRLSGTTVPPDVITVPSDFVPALSDTRGTGHYALTGSGLHVWTDGTPSSASTNKVAEYFARSGSLPDTASLEWTGTQPQPGMQIVFDVDGVDGNGNDFNILVGEPTYYGADWWLASSSSGDAKAADPSGANDSGSGSAYFGTLAQWKAALPNARMLAGGFSLGSGILGDGVIAALNYDATHYVFGKPFTSSVQAAPGATVEYQLTVANGSGPSTQAAAGVKVTDVLPPELTYVPGSLVDHGNGCAFAGSVLSCNAGTFPAGVATTITFKATLDDQISSAGLPTSEGHWVDVQKQEVFADLPAGQTKTYAALCPAGYIPTDGGLLLDAVDQGGFYSDVVISSSQQTSQAGVPGWTVTATNLGDERAQGKVKVTCLDGTVGSSSGHTHDLAGMVVGGQQMVQPGDAEGTAEFTRQCPAGYTPYAPVFDVVSGISVVRESYAVDNTWTWVVDHSDGTDAWFGISCLAPETAESNGHSARLVLSTVDDTITVGPETRAEGVQQCPDSANAIVGGYAGYAASVLSLGKEPRGNNYMFRFYNDDWDSAFHADIQVTCVGVRTTEEPTYRHVVNTAVVTTTTKDRDSSDNSSSADVVVDGDPVAPPPSGVTVGADGTRFVQSGKTKSVTLSQVTCGSASACSFTVRVIKAGDVVATKSTAVGAGVTKPIVVPTTSLGKNLGAGLVSVKVKTSAGTSTFPVNLS